MRLACTVAALAVCALAAPLGSIQEGCSCTATAAVGFRDATCSCAANHDYGLNELIELEAGTNAKAKGKAQAHVKQIETIQCSATCDGSTPGVFVSTCLCEAIEVPCPEHTSGYPTCAPNDGYSGSVTWDANTMAWTGSVSIATCPAVDGGTVTQDAATGDCTCGDFNTPAKLTWENGAFIDACTLVAAPDNAAYVDSDGENTAQCNDGYSKFPSSGGMGIPFNTLSRSWEASCAWAGCPEHTVLDSANNVCVCKSGFSGSVTWEASVDDASAYGWSTDCALAACPLNAVHESTEEDTDDFQDCVCEEGYHSADLSYDSSSGWTGTCNKVECDASLHEYGVFPCKCKAEHLDALSGTMFPSLKTDGTWSTCVETGCDFEGSIYADDGCVCEQGRATTVTGDAVSGHSIGCSAVKACPTGAVADSSGGTNECLCQDAGYSGESVWDGTAFGECTPVPCPENSVAGETGGCECNVGCTGAVTWSAPQWVNDCICTATQPANTVADADGGLKCAKGYKGVVTWGASSWTSTCTQEACPANAGSFPDCACSTGFVGGSGYKGMGLFWKEDGDGSMWTFCDTTDGSTCATAECKSVAAPDNSEVLSTGKAQCLSGYIGSPVWTDGRLAGEEGLMGKGDDAVGQFYTGTCTPALCPPNAVATVNESSSVRTCACKKGYVASEGGLAFTSSGWSGTCAIATCDAAGAGLSVNFPDYTCTRGSFPSPSSVTDGSGDTTAITAPIWTEGTGYSSCCAIKSCPDNADSSTWPWCTCLSTFQAKVDGVTSYSPSTWWDATNGDYLHTCEPVECPAGAGSHPDCDCGVGYSGTTKFVVNTWTPCTKVACPANSEEGDDTTSCVCKAGFSGIISWRATTQVWEGECEAVECPATLDCTDGVAACGKGYAPSGSGPIFVDGDWVSACVFIPCPDHSNGHPDCAADVGYKPSSSTNKPYLNFDANVFETVNSVACPDAATMTKTAGGQCVCNDHYTGTVTFDTSTGDYTGSCTETSCPAYSAFTLVSGCVCQAGYVDSADFGWRAGAWHGTCDQLDCTAIPDSELLGSSCVCKQGYIGSDTCLRAACPANADHSVEAGELTCKCVSGYSSPADDALTWTDGAGWTGTCNEFTISDGESFTTDDSAAKYAKCSQGYTGTITWNSNAWDVACSQVACPANSADSDGTCICQQGYIGEVSWSSATQSYIGDCVEVECPVDVATADAGTGCACNSPLAGDCTWNGANWGCTCKSDYENVPENAIITGNACACALGHTADSATVEISVPVDDSTITVTCPASCTVEMCSGSSGGQPGYCKCIRGMSGDDCATMATCPTSSSSTTIVTSAEDADPATGFLQCVCDAGKTGDLNWAMATQEWTGSCTAVSCDETNTGATGSAPDCACPDGSTDIFQPLVDHAGTYKGECSEIPCASGQGVQPECGCSPGFEPVVEGSVQTGCNAVACPSNAFGIGTCGCKEGYVGTPEWNTATNQWDHVCVERECPADASGAPYCACNTGYSGSLSFNVASMEYDGSCIFQACPQYSTRVTTVTSVDSVDTVSVSCKCHVGRSGGYEWIGSAFVGGCGDFQSPPEGADAQVLLDDPTIALTVYPTGPGYTGLAEWKTDASSGMWQSDIQKVSCPAGTTGHPTCACSPGHQGSSNWDILVGAYAATCVEASCPDTMEKVDATTCRCPVGYFGAASWNAKLVAFTGQQTCTLATCPAGMTPSDSKSHCQCGPGFAGSAAFETALQKYATATCSEQTCPTFADCTTSPPSCEANCKGEITWDSTTMQWDSTCELASCPTNAHRSTTGDLSCVCDTGFSPAPTIDSTTGDFVGCVTEAAAPANTVWAAGKYVCATGYKGAVYVDATTSELVSTCSQVPCDPISEQVDAATGACTCGVGYTGTMVWLEASETYSSNCGPAYCNADEIDCSTVFDPDRTVAITENLPCAPGFSGGATWSAGEWQSTCAFAGCSMNAAFDGESCKCTWGYEGAATYATDAIVGAGCILATCPEGTVRSADGIGCQCPASAFEGNVTFANGAWSAQCGTTVSCPEGAKPVAYISQGGMQVAVSDFTCACDMGYKGTVTEGVSLHTTHDDAFSAEVATSSMMASSCQKVSCPVNSEKHPDCECKTGFSGAVTFNETSGVRTYSSTCAIADCGIDHASGKPECSCDEGYDGALSFANGAWGGSCTPAACPENAGGAPACACNPGFQGTKKWGNGVWNFTCQEHFCPSNSAKVNDGSVCQCNAGYKREGGNDLSWSSHSGSYNGGCIAASCPANAVCVPLASVECNDGFKGSNADGTFTWDYATEGWAGVCEKVDCPAATVTVSGTATSASVCACEEGYTGTVEWSDGDWVVDCEPEPCPSFASSRFAEDSNSTLKCYCDFGYVREDDSSEALTFDNGAYVEKCKEVACPAHATRMTSGNCECAIGFSGDLIFADGAFTGSCVAVDCPADSKVASGSTNLGFGCECNEGFAGAEWEDDKDQWSACEPIPCPNNSERYPTETPGWMCQCMPGFTGSVVWSPITSEFTGSCTEHATQPTYSTITESALASASCRSVDGSTDTTAVYTSGGITFDFVKATIMRCDITVGTVDFSKIKGTFTITDQMGTDNSAAVPITQSKMLTEWYNVHTTMVPTDSFVAVGTPYNIAYAGEEGMTVGTSDTISITEVSVTPTKTLRLEVQQAQGAKLFVQLNTLETYNSVSEYVVMSTSTNTLPARRHH